MVTMIRSDLDFILAQIKIAEADARGETLLGTYIPNAELPWGLRRVDGSNNNLIAGQGEFGAAGNPFPRAATEPTTFLNEGDDAMPFGPPPFIPGTNLLTNNNYGVHTPNNPAITNPRAIQPGDVVDADPRIISNLIVDQSLNNPAAILAALKFAGSEDLTGDLAAIVAARDALKAALAGAGPAATPDQLAILLAAKTAADAAAADAAALEADAQSDKDAAQTIYDAAVTAEAAAEAASNAANQALINSIMAYAANGTPENEAAVQAAVTAATAAEGVELAAEQAIADATPALTAANGVLAAATAASNAADADADAADAAYQDGLTGGDTDPAVVAARAELAAVLEEKGVVMDGEDTVSNPNVAPDVGLSAPFNGWMTLFGQFFDHGLDLVAKGGYGTVYIPLQPDDPLYNPATPNTNFMALTRSTLDASGEAVNLVTPFVDQNQTYTSHASHQVFLREYETRADGKTYATGRLLNGNAESGNGLATWADVKAEAIDKLGIMLDDHDIHSVPLLRTDPYGKFEPGANGFAQVVVEVTQTVGNVATKTNVFIEGRAGGLDIHALTQADLPPTFVIQPGATVSLSVVPTGVAFLDDIAHAANPNAGEIADADDAVGLVGNPNLVYDDELLDQHYITGDGRGNENIGLTAVHHVFHSEHNRQVELIKGTLLADAQSLLDGGASQADAVEFLNEWLADPVTEVPATGDDLIWDGERLFQAAKVPTEMQYQHLVFEEFARKVQPAVNVFNDYDASLNPAIVAEFAHTVYRFGHSMLTETVDRYDADFNTLGTGGAAGADQIGLIEAFLNPIEFADSGTTAEEAAGAIVRGMTRQRGNAIDEFVTEALRNNLVGLPLDLAALNIARGRETGVPTLNEARAQFYEGSADSQIKPYVSWADFALNIKNPASVINFIAAYGTHSSITSATTTAAKRDAATKLVLGDNTLTGVALTLFNADRADFLNARGGYAGGSLGGLNNVDFWIGGLAEKQLVFGGMLGSTFNFVFETQLESLQNGDRFYYLSRLANLNLTAQLENNKFSELIHRNTNATHLPGDVFSTPDFILEVDQTKQFNEGLGNLDPTDPARDPVAAALNPLVQRDLATSLLRYNGEAHVVLGGTAGNDILIGGAGDDTLWGDAGDDRLEGGDGFDLIFGGDGNDIITDEAFDDEIRSGAGDDVVSAGNGVNLIITDTGRDFVWAGNDLDEILLGQDDDFGAGGGGEDTLIGGEGNDWLESGTENGLMLGDNGDLIQGLPIKRSVDSSIIGHDVLVSTGGNADFDAEQGDDVMVGGLGTDRFFGQFGFDWATYKNDPFGLEADMNLRLFVPPSIPASPGAILDRYAQMEALSGSRHADILRGDDEVDLGGGGAAAANNAAPLDHALKDENVALTRGLAEWLGAAINEAGENRFSTGNILLGGSGSDIIEGRGGDDLIDGNRWLNVRIEVLERLSNGTITNNVLESVDGMAALQARMFSGEIKVAQLRVVRELIDTRQGPNGETIVGVNAISNLNDIDNVDIAQYSGNLADYIIEGYNAQLGVATDQDGDGFISITDNRANPTDGVDRLKNMERALFADGIVKLTLHENKIAEGRATLSADGNVVAAGQVVGVEGQILSASMIGVTDADNVGTGNPTGAITDGVIYTWQMETAAGSGIFVDVETTVADEVAPVRGPTFTVTAAEAGLLIRVVARFKDADKVIETVYSNSDEGGNPNSPATGVPVISDTTPTEGSALTASTALIQDADGLGTFAFQWQLSTNGGATFTNIAGATAQTFTPAQAQVNGLLRVVVTFTDAGGTVETVTSAVTDVVGDLINDGAGGNTLNGTAGQDNINGNGGGDTINGLAGDDLLNGGAANDTITGGAGNDTIDGGAGAGDIVAFAGNASVFDVTLTGTTWTFTDQTGAEGTDTITNAEQIRFAGTTFTPTLGTNANQTQNGNAAANLIIGFGGDDTIIGQAGNDALIGGAGNDSIAGGTGDDSISGGAGNDTITWGVTNPVTIGPITILPAVTDGRDIVHGGIGGTDTFVINGNNQAETYRVYARADWLAVAGNTAAQLQANTDIVITRNGTNDASVIAELDEIEEIVINTGAGADTVLGIGNFAPTNLAFNTITVNDSDGNITVDARGMQSGHHFALNTTGTGGTILGARPQDEINGVATGSGSSGGSGGGSSGGSSSFTLTASDLAGLRAIINGQTSGEDDDLIVGVRSLSGAGNNTGHSGYGAADTPFIRLTDAHYGAYDAATGNRNVNPIFDNLDARAISDILGAQEANLPKAENGANIFFMAFGQYFDHGLDFLGKGGNGSIAIGGAGYSPVASANNPADLTRGSVIAGTAQGTPQHINKTSAFVDQNQAYGSNEIVGQFLRESNESGGVGSHLFAGANDPANTSFQLLPTLRELLDEHRLNNTIFTGPGLGAGKTLLDYYPTLWTAATGYNAAVVAQLAGDFMGSTHALLLDTNPGVNLLDHYVAGDGRANENVSLTAMHTIWARNHNFHVENLIAHGFDGTAEQLFQAAKVLNEAEYQRVVFDEFADTLIGGIKGNGSHGHDKYDPNATASISHEFAAAVYRVGHSLISDTLTVIGSNGQSQQVRLVDAFLNPTNDPASFTGPLPPGYVPQPGFAQIGANGIIAGTITQAAEEVDFNIVDAVRNDLVRIRADLFAFNVARGRDVGLGTLNQVRADLRDSNDPYVKEAAGFAGNLDPYTSWEDFQSRNGLSDTVINQFKLAYPDLVLAAADIAAFFAINPDITVTIRPDGTGVVKGIDRVDLWVGGLAEKHINGGMVGQTFWVVLQEQFDRLQQADRFYYTDRLDNLDLYENIIDGQNFADIIARNTGLTGLPESVFEVDDEDTSTGGDSTVDSDGDDDAVGGGGDDDLDDDDDTTSGGDNDDEDDDDNSSDDEDDDEDDDDSPSDDDDDDDDSDSDDDDDSDGDGAGSGSGAGSGNNIPFVVYLGTDTSNQAFGSAAVDAMSGNGGDDTLFGFGGNDTLLGGSGKDSLFGGDGDDVLAGNEDDDHLEGGAGNDNIMGGDGKDVLLGGDGDDILIGDAGNDRINGGAGNDTVFISDGDGNDAIDGGDGVDTIDISGIAGGAIVNLGLTGFGQITAAGQSDTLIGFENVIGGAGNDTIVASVKVNVLNGGGGNDTFVFESAAAANGDVINGFSPGDKIDLGPMYDSLGLSGAGFTQVGADADFNAAGQLRLKVVGNDTVIEGNTDNDADTIDFSLTIAGYNKLTMNEISS